MFDAALDFLPAGAELLDDQIEWSENNGVMLRDWMVPIVADAEAGAAPSDKGGITPVSEMGRSGPDASGEAEETKKPEDAGAESPEAQKKTLMRSNWS